MADREHLTHRYADLLEPEFDGALLQMVEALDEAAAPYRQLQVPHLLDASVHRLAASRRVPRVNGEPIQANELGPATRFEAPSRLPARLRTGWFRQGLGMVAAALVLVLLAGVLAVTFHNQGQNGQGGLGGGATATTSPGLPMTVTTNGIAVTLESVEVGPNTIFDFSVILPPDLAKEADLSIPSARPFSFLKVDGLTTGPNDPIVELGTHAIGSPIATFAAHYSNVPSPNQTITVTILRLPFTTTPSNPSTVEGPWKFVITPAMIADHSLPTPNETGHYTGITFEQAQQLAPFTLAQPQWVPSYLVKQWIEARALPQLEFPNGTPTLSSPSNPKLELVTLMYTLQDSTQNGLVAIQETGHSVQAGIPNDATQTTVTMAGLAITKSTFTMAVPMAEYQWQMDGTYFDVSVHFAGPITEQDVEHMIASMIDASATLLEPVQVVTPNVQPATPAATPSAVPLSQADGVWNSVLQRVGTTIDPILKPGQLPDGIETIVATNEVPGAFEVEYDGPQKQLRIGVFSYNPSLCGDGCTQSQITVRGQQATLQVNDAHAGHITLWWDEPGSWVMPNHPQGVAYMISSDGLTEDEVLNVAQSLAVASP